MTFIAMHWICNPWHYMWNTYGFKRVITGNRYWCVMFRYWCVILRWNNPKQEKRQSMRDLPLKFFNLISSHYHWYGTFYIIQVVIVPVPYLHSDLWPFPKLRIFMNHLSYQWRWSWELLEEKYNGLGNIIIKLHTKSKLGNKVVVGRNIG